MTDIVTSLRAHRSSAYMCQDCYGTVMDEAADEIEHLRLTLAELGFSSFLLRSRQRLRNPQWEVLPGNARHLHIEQTLADMEEAAGALATGLV